RTLASRNACTAKSTWRSGGDAARRRAWRGRRMMQRVLVLLLGVGLAALLLASNGQVAPGQAGRPTAVPRGQGPPTVHPIPPKCYGGGVDAQGRVWLYLAPAGPGCPAGRGGGG